MASKSTAKKAEQLRISQISDFKNRMSAVIELPSGVVVKVRNPGGLQAFVGQGLIPNTLLSIVSKSLDGGKKNRASSREEMANIVMDDPETMSSLNKMMDNITVRTVVEPRVHLVPTADDVEANNLKFPEAPVDDPEDLRYDDRLYVDEFPDEDKQFIFQWVTSGNSDLETFRQGLKANMDALGNEPSVQSATK